MSSIHQLLKQKRYWVVFQVSFISCCLTASAEKTLTDMPWPILWKIGSCLVDRQARADQGCQDLRAVKATCKDLCLRMQDERLLWRLENGHFWSGQAHAKRAKGPALFTARRKQLCELVAQKYREGGAIVLVANVRNSLGQFLQESSFEYYTGLEAPGVVLFIEFGKTQKTTLFTPEFTKDVSQWSINPLDKVSVDPAKYGIDEIVFLGESTGLTEVEPFSPDNFYVKIVERLQSVLAREGKVFTVGLTQTNNYQPRVLYERLIRMLGFDPAVADKHNIVDISEFVTHMRRKKDIDEIKAIYKGLQVTYQAFCKACNVIRPGQKEIEVKAEIEKIFKIYGCPPAYGSIVHSGQAAKVLHDFEDDPKKRLKKDELMLIDAAAMCCHECADITRVFPVNGSFSPRQRQLMNIVIAAQRSAIQVAKPGAFLTSKEDVHHYYHKIPLEYNRTDKLSLRLAAHKQLIQNSCQPMPHGVGHHLGLDTHDVCPTTVPLEVGDVFTIEPGVYDEFGIRHEDDFLMMPEGAMRLSHMFPSTPEEIEQMMARHQK